MLGGISKRGDVYLRTLLIHGARSVIAHIERKPEHADEWLKKLINDPAVEIVPNGAGGREPGAPSRMDSEMFRAFESTQHAMFPGAITLPAMLTGATDNAQLRAKGVQAYGFGPIVDEKDAAGGGAGGEERAHRLGAAGARAQLPARLRCDTEGCVIAVG